MEPANMTEVLKRLAARHDEKPAPFQLEEKVIPEPRKDNATRG